MLLPLYVSVAVCVHVWVDSGLEEAWVSEAVLGCRAILGHFHSDFAAHSNWIICNVSI